MHAIYPHLIMGLCALALLASPKDASAAANNDCAILATAEASDLAVDDPARFERLTQACSHQRSTPTAAPRATPGAHKQGQPPQKVGGSPKSRIPQRVADAPTPEGERRDALIASIPSKATNTHRTPRRASVGAPTSAARPRKVWWIGTWWKARRARVRTCATSRPLSTTIERTS